MGLTQEELAEQLEVSRQSISKWESARSIPDISKIMAMARLFSVSTDYLLRDEIETLEGELFESNSPEQSHIVSIETANAFIDSYQRQIEKIATAVLLCIISVIPLIVLIGFVGNALSEQLALSIGLIFLFICIAVAVGIFIYSATLVSDYKYLFKGDFELSNNVPGIIKEYRKLYRPERTRNLIIGVSLFIISPVALIVQNLLLESATWSLALTGLLLLIVAGGVFLIIRSEGKHTGFDILLSEGDYRKSKLKNVKKSEQLFGAYWSVVTVIYLAWSFLAQAWEISWLIWPIAVLLYIPLNLIFSRAKN